MANTAEARIPIEAIIREVGGYSEEIVNAVADALLKEVKAQARQAFKGTGRNPGKSLRKNIRKKKDRFEKEAVIVGAFAPHAHLVEFGHKIKVGKDGKVLDHEVEAKPFLRPAADAVTGRLQEIVNSIGPVEIVVKN